MEEEGGGGGADRTTTAADSIHYRRAAVSPLDRPCNARLSTAPRAPNEMTIARPPESHPFSSEQ